MVRLEPAAAETNEAMSKKTATLAAYEQTAYQRAELDAFQRMLTISEGTFSLSVAICNSPALRDHIIEHIRNEVRGIEVVRLHRDTRDILNFAQKQVGDARPKAIFTTNMEEAIAGDQRDRVLQGLNVSREQWQATYQCPVVFWLPDYVISLLMTHARDFWSWVSHHFEFVSEQASASAGLQGSYAGNITLAANLDVHEKRFRIAELEQRIAEAGNEPEGQLREHISPWRNELAYLYMALGELDTAMALLKEQERICHQLGNVNGLQRSLGNQALILQARGDLGGAMALHKEQERICRQLSNLDDLSRTLGNQALILQDRGDLDGAMALHKEQERICRQLGNLDGLSISLGNQAVILQAHGDLDGAMALHKEEERICRQLGNLDGLQHTLGNQAVILQARGDLDGAMALHKEKERICRQLGNPESLAISLINQASVLRQMGRAREALPLAEQAHELATGHGYAALVKRIEPILNELRHATQGT
jgi:tetratricopeptide (TPR) repeat protein